MSKISDEVLMDFMKEVREDVKLIRESVGLHGERIGVVEESQRATNRNTPKTNALWCAIGVLVGLLIPLLISYIQIKKDYAEDRPRKEQSAIPRGDESGI